MMPIQKEFRAAIKTISELNSYLGTTIKDNGYPLFIPTKIATRIKKLGLDSAYAKQFLPSIKEMRQIGMDDPIGDQRYLVTKGLIHRYPTRALFLPINICPVICRYCFRKNELMDNKFSPDMEETIRYLKEHSEIEEIIFSGGDPFILSDGKLKIYLDAFGKIKHLKYIRFHTRILSSIPSRVDDSLIKVISSTDKEIIFAIHVNQIEEIDSDFEKKIELLKARKITLLSQTVLLKEVNDHPTTIATLLKKTSSLGIRPYYLHHPDQVKGGMHFTLPLAQGRKIYHRLRSLLPGWMIPHYIIDIPGGEGKTWAFNPESFHYGGKMINKDQEFLNIDLAH